jgi:spermidine synthase
VQAELAATAGVRLNRDLAPICYYYDLALWLSRFYPHLRVASERAGLASLWWVAVPLVLIVGLARWRRVQAVPLAIAGIGLAEMTLEVVILFAFQVLHGTVYARISLIVTAFMAGLALGGAAGTRLLARWGDGGRKTVDEAVSSTIHRPSSVKRNARHALILIQLAIAAYSALLPLTLSLPVPVPVPAFPLLALVAGGLTGMAFPLAVPLMRGSADRAAGLLYGADLVGGCLGALVGAVLFVPVLGIPQTCAAVALVGVAGILMLV